MAATLTTFATFASSARMIASLVLMTALAQDAWGDPPNYPPEPTVIEYRVDPAWPKRPATLGPRAAVPSIAVDREDRIWCLERGKVPVQVYSPEGDLVTSWGEGQFQSPHSLRFDRQGNVWITDHVAHVVTKWTPEGKLLLTLGTPGRPGADEAHFNGPTDTAITPAGDVFVTDGYGNRRVVHFDAQGNFVKAWGAYGGGPGQFCLPHQIVVDSGGILYVADRNSGRIQLFDQEGTFLDQWPHLVMPWGLWITPRDELWVCGSSPQAWYKDGHYPPPKDQLFMRFSTDGRLRQLWTVPVGQDGREKPGECNWLHAVAVDSQGNLYAGDINGKRAQKFVRTPAAATAAAEDANRAVRIDADFPGGNIIVERQEGDTVFVRQDLRDTQGDWFYWCFRVRGAQGRTLTFRFTGSNVFAARGPACSLDGGVTWQWLGTDCVQGKSFTYRFPAHASDVRFSVGMPYLEDALERFLDAHRGSPHLRVEELCKSRKGRSVELLRLGRLDGKPEYRVLVTCRHHACEMMASYVLEGMMAETLAGSESGRWLREHVEFLVVPFVDKDGVEDGDQGKNRKPHDHNRDYAGKSIYPEVAALKERVPDRVADRPCFGFDLHCPWIRGGYHEQIMSPSRARDLANWQRLRPFLETLEKTQSGPLGFKLSVSEKFLSWDGKPPDPKGVPQMAAGWMLSLPNMQWALVFEIPYANADGEEVNQETARRWGRDLAVALQRDLAERYGAVPGP